MPRPIRAFGLFLVLLVAPMALAAPRPLESARYGVFMKTTRIGYMTSATYTDAHDGKPGRRLESELQIKMTALGSAVEQRMVTTQWVDTAGKPLEQTVTLSSMGRDTIIRARFEATRVVCDLTAGGQRSQQVVPIPKGVELVADPETAGPGKQTLKVGQKERFSFFEPLTLSIQTVGTEILKSEVRKVAGKQQTVFLMKSTNSAAGDSETWVDADGKMLEDTGTGGIRLVREDLGAEWPTLAYEPPQDFAVATALKTAPVPAPRKARLLRIRISQLPDEALILSDARQQVPERKREGATWTATYRIEARPLPSECLPVAAAGSPGLADAAYLGIGDPAIQAKAKELAGKETDRGIVARRIRAWVKGHMLKQNNIGTPRSATEIMRTRDGVCRDYATLFAAVARAAGVPARVCSGLLYFDGLGGGFFYHAWVECQLTAGDSGWYPLDATLEDDFVDATHLKFAQGDPVEMFAAVRVIGQIRAEVLESQ